MIKHVLRIAVPAVVVIGGATGVFLSSGEKNCNELVDMSNKIVDTANAATTAAQEEALVPQLGSAATDIRSTGQEFGEPFRADAASIATSLESIATAISARDEKGYDAGITSLNAAIDKSNADCDAAR